MNLKNERALGESFDDYRTRLRVNAKAVEMYLRTGNVATGYQPGPHKTHKPHDITTNVMMLNASGVPGLREFTVRHPGTLYRVPA